ncbi:MAG: glycosyltransferase family 9 protein [Bacteroidia bacterium]|nr:glycosyltransferase family 9 protein [Bacteroidia bacterium]
MLMTESPNIIISRCDSIGDVVLTLPMAGVIKSRFPKARVIFLGRTYTKEVVALCEHVDEFLNYDELKHLPHAEQIAVFKKLNAEVILHVFPKKEIALLAEQAGIPLRVGTLSRLYHWYTCNRKLHLPRKNSDLHEAQLNLKLLGPLGITTNLNLQEIAGFYGFKNVPELPEKFKSLIDGKRFNLILHPKSKGSAREWGLDNFQTLFQLLPPEKFKVFVSGTKEDGEQLKDWLKLHPQLMDITGSMSLKEFIAFIATCDGLVAASTGPLHIAAALGKTAIGLFAPMRPIHPGRWKPIGLKAQALVMDKKCNDCRKGTPCHCIAEIRAQQVIELLPKT